MTILREPRVFWSVGRIDTSAGTGRQPANALPLPRRDFFNGSRWPITLRQLIVAPIGYQFARFDSGAAATGPMDFANSAEGALNSAAVKISVPQGPQLIKEAFDTQLFAPEPRWEPARSLDVGLLAPPYDSNLWGAYRWRFDAPMVMPARGAVEFGLGGVRALFGAGTPVAYGQVALEEPGGLLPGNQRLSVRNPLAAVDPTATYPWGTDGFAVNGVSFQTWNPATTMTPRLWKTQAVTAAGDAPVTGFAVHIDQLDWDQATIDDMVAIFAGGSGVVAPLGLSTPTRARTVDGGSHAWWWREGAPLALVTPTMTPGHVYTLPQPITLAPGDKLDVELIAHIAPNPPGPGVLNDNPNATPPNTQIIQIGVSLCGEACIEQ